MIQMTNFTATPVAVNPVAAQNLSWNPSRVDWATLNGQPLPSKEVFQQAKAAYNSEAGFGPHASNPEADRGIIIIGGKSQVRLSNTVMPGDWASLNPQPLPPKEVFQQFKAAYNANAGFGANSANAEAQHGIIFVGGKGLAGANVMTPGDWVSINPQPLPPKEGFQQFRPDFSANAAFGSTGANLEAQRGIIIIGGKSVVR